MGFFVLIAIEIYAPIIMPILLAIAKVLFKTVFEFFCWPHCNMRYALHWTKLVSFSTS